MSDDLVDKVAKAIHMAGIVNTKGYAIHNEESRAAIAVVLQDQFTQMFIRPEVGEFIEQYARENGIDLK